VCAGGLTARDALEMVHTVADEFAQEVAQLCSMNVTAGQCARFLDAHVCRTDAKTGEPLKGRAHGVIQAVNTASPTGPPWARLWHVCTTVASGP